MNMTENETFITLVCLSESRFPYTYCYIDDATN